MYVSTRSACRVHDYQAILKGIAPDGGLFVPEEIPKLDWKSLKGLSYTQIARKVMSLYLPSFSSAMEDIVQVYPRKFDCGEITPVRDVGGRHILELWHGPTAAFKDLALSVLPLFMTEAIRMDGMKDTVVILTATSGDTGKAALEGFHDVPGTEIVVFFPHGGVSDTQRLQMVTQEGRNVRVYAVRGNFDDCQRGVKEAFAHAPEGKFLSSANSINIGRLIPQIVYYFYAYLSLNTEAPVSFSVPTGNFGDILAGYLAKEMGLPVDRLICASNDNNVLYDFLTTGVYDRRRELKKTISPSMDILVSSNLERLLYFASEGNSDYVADLMRQLSSDGVYQASDEVMDKIRNTFDADCCSEEDCLATIGNVWKDYSYLIDPHTAVAYHHAPEGCVVLSTASPYKFSPAVSSAIGMDLSLTGVPMPEGLKNLDKKDILHRDVIEKTDIGKECLK